MERFCSLLEGFETTSEEHPRGTRQPDLPTVPTSPGFKVNLGARGQSFEGDTCSYGGKYLKLKANCSLCKEKQGVRLQ